MSGSIDNTKVTSQGSFMKLFEDDDLKSIVSQIKGGTGTRKAKILFGVGFASVPVESDRLICAEIGNGLYALGGSCESVIEELALADGERCIFSTDADGEIQSKTVWKNDGTVEIGDGTEPVAMSGYNDRFIALVDDIMTNAVDPLTGGAWASAKAAAFPETGGVIPSTASENLNADVPPLIPVP